MPGTTPVRRCAPRRTAPTRTCSTRPSRRRPTARSSTRSDRWRMPTASAAHRSRSPGCAASRWSPHPWSGPVRSGRSTRPWPPSTSNSPTTTCAPWRRRTRRGTTGRASPTKPNWKPSAGAFPAWPFHEPIVRCDWPPPGDTLRRGRPHRPKHTSRTEERQMTQVLVTGGSGFIGSWCVLSLLDAGHTVRTTVRDLRRAPALRSWLHAAKPFDDERLTVVRADLEQPDGWDDAVADCDFVLHVASPTLRRTPANDDEMVLPAREGVLRVPRASRDAGVRRVVLTSAFGAIGIGHPPALHPVHRGGLDQRRRRHPALPAVQDPRRARRLAVRRGRRRWSATLGGASRGGPRAPPRPGRSAVPAPCAQDARGRGSRVPSLRDGLRRRTRRGGPAPARHDPPGCRRRTLPRDRRAQPAPPRHRARSARAPGGARRAGPDP
ncbi:hypothetical protein SGPA1_40091 [Streptomyces misionensis JCM 4497]